MISRNLEIDEIEFILQWFMDDMYMMPSHEKTKE